MNAFKTLEMNVVGIYVRLSDEDRNKFSKEDDSESIKNQKLLLTEYAINQGWQIYRIYCDDDWSGLDSKRPQFNQLIKDCEDGKINIVLCKTQSRFTRDAELVERYLHNKFLEWKIRFVGLLDHTDTSVKGNKKARQINGLVNEWYCEDLSENIRTVFNAKMRNGENVTSFAPYGYVKKDGNYVVDEYAANVVRHIFDLYLKGNGTHRIAQILYEEGYEKPAVYKQKILKLNWQSPHIKDGVLWGHTTINRILKDETYIGSLCQARETTVSYKNRTRIQRSREDWIIIKNNHPAIVSEDDFYAVQKLLSAKRQSGKHKGAAHIFATKVHCLHCGATMTLNGSYTKTAEGRRLNHKYFKCKNYGMSNGVLCAYPSVIRYSELYEVVNKEFQKIISSVMNNDENQAYVVDKIKKSDDSDNYKEKIEQNIRICESKIEERTNALSQLYLDKVNGTIDANQYDLIFAKFQSEIKHWQEKLTESNEMMRVHINHQSSKINVEKLVANYKEYSQLNHEISSKCINDIIIGTDEDNNITVDVKWNLAM